MEKSASNWPKKDWENVVISDESALKHFFGMKMAIYQPRRSNRIEPQYTCKTFKPPPGVLMWGSFSSKGHGGLHMLGKNTTINNMHYIKILEEMLVMQIHVADTHIFMQDNALLHVSKEAIKCFNNFSMTVSDWLGISHH